MSFHWTTFLFQIANFLVLLVVLWRLLWRPLRRHMLARRQRIDTELAAIEDGRAEIAAAHAEVEAALQQARSAEADAKKRAAGEAETERAALLEHAREEAWRERERIVAQAKADAERDRRQALETLTPAIGTLIERLLREVGWTVSLHDRTCDRMAEHLDAMSEAERQTLQAAAAAGTWRIVSAQAGVSRRLADAVEKLLHDGAMHIDAEPDLIAGAQLLVGERVVDGSLRAQVQRVMESLQ